MLIPIVLQWINVDNFRQVSSQYSWWLVWSVQSAECSVQYCGSAASQATVLLSTQKAGPRSRGTKAAPGGGERRGGAAAAASDRLGRAESVQWGVLARLEVVVVVREVWGSSLEKTTPTAQTDFLEIPQWLSSAEFWISPCFFSNVWRQSGGPSHSTTNVYKLLTLV